MIDLNGSLKSTELLPLVRLLSKLHQTGTLVLSSDGWSARLGLEDGRVVAATLGDENGMRALMALNRMMAEAEFVYLDGLEADGNAFDLTPEGRTGRFARNVGIALDLDAIPTRVSEPFNGNGNGDEVLLKRRAVQHLMAIDGRRTVRDIVGDRPNLGSLLDLAQLVDLGLVTVESGAWQGIPVGLPLGLSSGRVDDFGNARLSADARGAAVARGARLTSAADLTDSSGEPLLVCPNLGYADDSTSHFAQATLLHRCYASGRGKRVSSGEQRELCLGDQFPTCPRFNGALLEQLTAGAEPRTLANGVRDLPRLGAPHRTSKRAASSGSNGNANGVPSAADSRVDTHDSRVGRTTGHPPATQDFGAIEAASGQQADSADLAAVGASYRDQALVPVVAPAESPEPRPEQEPQSSRTDGLVRAVSIGLAIAALIASALVFLLPRIPSS